MAKGVKKIKWVPRENDAKVFPTLSIANKLLVIKPNKWAWFEVSEWEDGTTPLDKKKDITWMRQNSNRKEVLNYSYLKAEHFYGVKLPKKLCGVYTYYIEASLLGKRDFANDTGLKVRGPCEAKIISSKWCVTNDGEDQRSKQFKYGHLIYLNLETEGLNGVNNLIVDVFKIVEGGGGTSDDKHVATYTNVQVIDGEVNLKMGNTSSWFVHARNDIEKFYVKVKAGNRYITDGKDAIHARFLQMKRDLVTTAFEVSTNNTPLKIGKADTNVKNYHPCKFEKIIVTDGTDAPSTVFEEGKTSLKKETTSIRYEKQEVLFDFDKHLIRADAQAVLDELLQFLLKNEHLAITLSGHADDRGELDYNQRLSEKRADEVRLYLFKKGLDKTKFNIAGYGEVRPKAFGNTEDSYQKNRRVVIEFAYVEYNAQVMVYETVAGSRAKTKNIQLKLEKLNNKQCFRDGKDRHTQEIIVKEKTTTITKSGDQIAHDVFSYIGADFRGNYWLYLLDYLNPLATIHNSFLFHINTCAYYANKENPTLQIKAYPDVVWIGHFQYTSTEEVMPYYFHQKNFGLEQGIITALNELKKTVFYKIWRIIPANFIMEKTVLKYIEDQAKSYFYGIDTIHDRTLEKTGEDLSLVGTHTNLLTQTQYTKYAAAAVIYEFVVIGIIIDLLIIYLTRGKSLEGRILKLANNLKKAQQYIKLMEDAGIEIIPPSIAINAGMYYKKQNDGRLALVYEANLKADPLVALNYKKEFDLLSLITKGIENIKGAKHPKDKKVKEKLERNKENNNSIVEHFKSIGVPAIKGSIDVTGSILFEKKIQYNLLTNTYTFTDKLGNLVQTAHNEVIIKKQIDFNATIKGKFDGKFEFFRLETSFEGKVDFTLKGSTGIKLSYGLDNKGGRGLFVSKSLYCSGVEGTYLGSLKVKGSLGDILDWSSNEGKPTPFTLIEPFEVPFFDIQLFKS